MRLLWKVVSAEPLLNSEKGFQPFSDKCPQNALQALLLPIIRLMDALSAKDYPALFLNRSALIDCYGKAYTRKLPRRNERAICHADGLMDLDDVVIDAGYESGDNLFRA